MITSIINQKQINYRLQINHNSNKYNLSMTILSYYIKLLIQKHNFIHSQIDLIGPKINLKSFQQFNNK